MPNARTIVLGLMLGGLLAYGYQVGIASYPFPEETVAVESPSQTALPAGVETFPYKSYTINPLASFVIEALVLSKANYFMFGREAQIAPVDLALGWGPMSGGSVLRKLNIWQSGRFYFWQTKGPELPIPREEITRHSANMHLIPANPKVTAALRRVRRGEMVLLKGYLVEVRQKDGWRWRSSLSREDSGWGSCELIWVEEMEIK